MVQVMLRMTSSKYTIPIRLAQIEALMYYHRQFEWE